MRMDERENMNLSNKSGIYCSRRDFIRLGLTSAAALALGANFALAKEEKKKKKKIPVGLQLYSVRSACDKDLPGTLKKVKEIGYSGVEFAGYYGRTAKDMRKLLDDNGLKCYGTHTGLDTLRGDNLKKTMEYNQILGNPNLICPWMQGNSADAWKKLAEEFNAISDIVRKEKMYVGYHAHAHDFNKFDGVRAWDIFFGGTKDEVIMQLDTSNCLDGKADPLEVLKKYPKRARTIHLKEHGDNGNAVIGEGEVKWDEIFKFCESNGTKYYIVEHERGNDPESCIKAVRGCFEGLKKMGKV